MKPHHHLTAGTVAALLLLAAAFTTGRAQDPDPDPAPAAADNEPAAGDNASTGDDGTRIPAFDTVVDEVLVRGVPLTEWLMQLAAEKKFNLLLAKGVPAGAVQLRLRDLPLGIAINVACVSQGCRVSIAHGIAFVWPERTGDDQPARDVQAFKVEPAGGDFDALLGQVRSLATAGGIVVGHAGSRVLFVVDTAEARRAVARYIAAVEAAGRDR